MTARGRTPHFSSNRFGWHSGPHLITASDYRAVSVSGLTTSPPHDSTTTVCACVIQPTLYQPLTAPRTATHAASLTASDWRAISVSGLDHNCSRILHPTKTNAQLHTACVPHCNATSLAQVRNAGAPVRHARACLCSCRVTPVAGGRSCGRHQVRFSREACVCVHAKMFICASA